MANATNKRGQGKITSVNTLRSYGDGTKTITVQKEFKNGRIDVDNIRAGKGTGINSKTGRSGA